MGVLGAEKFRKNHTTKTSLLLAMALFTASTASALTPFQQATATMAQLDPTMMAQKSSESCEVAPIGTWLRLKDPVDFSPQKRYGHSALVYEPATSEQLQSLKEKLRLADINKRQAQELAGERDKVSDDTSFMIVFGGKNAESDVLFNDIYFLGIPSFEWYMPKLSAISGSPGPSPRLGHAAAIYEDKMFIFGGHTISLPNGREISNELFKLDLSTMQWSQVDAVDTSATLSNSQSIVDSQNMVKPLAYSSFTVLKDSSRLALFGGLSQDLATAEFGVLNEVIFLDLTTEKWKMPSKVYANSMEDVPAARMGASMVYYNDKLWVFMGGDPYGAGVLFDDYFSFNLNSGLWKKENDYVELNSSDGGALLGQAVRMYNSDAVVFSGGCNIATQTCQFGVTKSILFGQPSAHFSNGTVDLNNIAGRMGHSLVQLGDAVISFGGCSFGQLCTNELVIQKPKTNDATNIYDCKNGGQIIKVTVQGLSLSYCQCIDLASSSGSGKFFTGPQCQFETSAKVPDAIMQAQIGQAQQVLNVNQPELMSQVVASGETTKDAAPAKKSDGPKKPALDDDGSCDAGCNKVGICFDKKCFCDKYHTGEKCENDLAHPGVKAPISFIFYGVALFLGLITGGFVAKIYNENNKKLFL